jgi:adenine/guanine phosphoribosyltransferase-like PRPP-binding protein
VIKFHTKKADKGSKIVIVDDVSSGQEGIAIEKKNLIITAA